MPRLTRYLRRLIFCEFAPPTLLGSLQKAIAYRAKQIVPPPPIGISSVIGLFYFFGDRPPDIATFQDTAPPPSRTDRHVLNRDGRRRPISNYNGTDAADNCYVSVPRWSNGPAVSALLFAISKNKRVFYSVCTVKLSTAIVSAARVNRNTPADSPGRGWEEHMYIFYASFSINPLLVNELNRRDQTFCSPRPCARPACPERRTYTSNSGRIVPVPIVSFAPGAFDN